MDLFNGECVEKCEHNEIYDVYNVCKKCPVTAKYKQGNSCLQKCNDGYAYDEEFVCYLCSEKNQTYEEGKCVDNCSKGYEKTNYTFNYTLNGSSFDEEICITCKSQGKFY